MAHQSVRLSISARALRCWAVACLLLLHAMPAWARPVLRSLPAAVLLSYASVVRTGEIAIVETDSAGRALQITLLGYAAAPPPAVYALVADPLRYPRYVRNLTRSDVEHRPDGSMLNRWRLTFPIGSFDGTDEVRLISGGEGAASGTGAVEMRAVGEGKQGTTRWEFLPLPGGGTLVVNYGYYDPLDNAFLRVMIGQDPALDAGFNLAGGLALVRGLLAEAGREARASGLQLAAPSAGAAPDFGPLLARGTVAVVRTGGQGQLVDVSVVERVSAAAQHMQELVRAPENWPRFLHTVKRVDVTQRDPAGLEYDMTVAGFLIDVVTTFRMVFVPGGADTLAIGGAVKGARFRWDIRPDPGGSVVVWRGNLHLTDTSRMLRAMLRIEPSFEHSANISMGLISVRSLAAQALPAR